MNKVRPKPWLRASTEPSCESVQRACNEADCEKGHGNEKKDRVEKDRCDGRGNAEDQKTHGNTRRPRKRVQHTRKAPGFHGGTITHPRAGSTARRIQFVVTVSAMDGSTTDLLTSNYLGTAPSMNVTLTVYNDRHKPGLISARSIKVMLLRKA